VSVPVGVLLFCGSSTDYQGGVYWHRNTGGAGSLSFAARVTLVASGSYFSYVALGRINADSVMDIAIAVCVQLLRVSLGSRSGLARVSLGSRSGLARHSPGVHFGFEAAASQQVQEHLHNSSVRPHFYASLTAMSL
jgi:hypothetical protein